MLARQRWSWNDRVARARLRRARSWEPAAGGARRAADETRARAAVPQGVQGEECGRLRRRRARRSLWGRGSRQIALGAPRLESSASREVPAPVRTSAICSRAAWARHRIPSRGSLAGNACDKGSARACSRLAPLAFRTESWIARISLPCTPAIWATRQVAHTRDTTRAPTHGAGHPLFRRACEADSPHGLRRQGICCLKRSGSEKARELLKRVRGRRRERLPCGPKSEMRKFYRRLPVLVAWGPQRKGNFERTAGDDIASSTTASSRNPPSSTRCFNRRAGDRGTAADDRAPADRADHRRARAARRRFPDWRRP